MPAVLAPSKPIVKPHTVSWKGRLAARFIHGFIRALAHTIRFEYRDQSGFLQQPTREPVILCIWHNRLALCLVIYQQYVQHAQPERRMAAVVSASRDGGLLARVLELFFVQPVRGSSSRRGAQALLELTSWAEKGYDLAITPDGPRGPRYVVHEGAVALAQLTGLPIVPVCYHLNRKIVLKSWDRFQIPLPLARCSVSLGPLVRLSRDMSDLEREDARRQIESILLRLTRDD